MIPINIKKYGHANVIDYLIYRRREHEVANSIVLDDCFSAGGKAALKTYLSTTGKICFESAVARESAAVIARYCLDTMLPSAAEIRAVPCILKWHQERSSKGNSAVNLSSSGGNQT